MGIIIPDPGLLFWMIISFVIVLLILKKYAWKPIINALKNRERSIENALRLADKAKAEMTKLLADNEKILAEGRLERDKLIKEARQTKERIIEEARTQAKEEVKALMENARVSINIEKKAAIGEIKDQVAMLSVLVAEKIIREKLSEGNNQSEYIDHLLKDIKLN